MPPNYPRTSFKHMLVILLPLTEIINNNAQDQQSYTSRPVATAVSLEKREFGSLKLFPKV
jgi:hypothetical protein